MKTLSYEECFICSDLTGRSGEGEDSLYCDECDKGPYCPDCFRKHHESDMKVARLEAELGDFRDRRDEKFQMYEDCKAENAALKRKGEKLPEYKALASLVNKHRVVYEDNHSGDGVIAFDDTELADAVVNLASALLADTKGE